MPQCKSCGAQIRFVLSRNNKYIPCNAKLIPYKQTEDGKEIVITEDGEYIRCTLEFDGFPTGMARTPHWATCPDADKFRRKKNDIPEG